MIFDRPTSIELLTAVIDFLNTEIKEELPPHLVFKLRIVTNVLQIVQREIDLGENLSKEAEELIKEVIESTQEPSLVELANSIKSNTELDKDSLKDALIEITKSKISVDNPRYSTFKKLVE